VCVGIVFKFIKLQELVSVIIFGVIVPSSRKGRNVD